MFQAERVKSNEKVDLFESITALEKAEIPNEYLPMWEAENYACFPHFLAFAEDEMKSTLSLAKNGDEIAIAEINKQYQQYRNDIESSLMENSPEVYNAFIDAVSRADANNASEYMANYINEIAALSQEDDDED